MQNHSPYARHCLFYFFIGLPSALSGTQSFALDSSLWEIKNISKGNAWVKTRALGNLLALKPINTYNVRVGVFTDVLVWTLTY